MYCCAHTLLIISQTAFNQAQRMSHWGERPPLQKKINTVYFIIATLAQSILMLGMWLFISSNVNVSVEHYLFVACLVHFTVNSLAYQWIRQTDFYDMDLTVTVRKHYF